MKRIRIRVTILVTWVIFLSIINRLLDPIELSNITIGSVIVILVAELLIPRMPRDLVWLIMFVPIAVLLVTRFWSRNPLSDQAIFLTIIEVFVIAVTMILSHWVRIALDEFESAVAYITLGPSERRLENTQLGQGLIYREVRRARNHQLPLALISIGVDDKTIEPATERLVQEIQQSMMKQYKLQGLSKMLCDELEDSAILVQDTDRYLALIPDTLPEELPIVVERLRKKAYGQVGVELKIGLATLPQDGFTFVGLVERATREMENDRVPQRPGELADKFPMEHRITE